MKSYLFFPALLLFSAFLVGCNNDDDTPALEIVDPTLPSGTFVISQMGDFVALNSTPTQGTAELGQDSENVTFLRFTLDFTTALATGTVSVYFSTSEDFVADPPNGNPDLLLVGIVQANGEAFYRIDGGVDAKFSHVILWCGSANIPFGVAELN